MNKKHFSLEDYDDFVFIPSTQTRIDMKPYEFTFACHSDQEINNFKVFYIGYLKEANILSSEISFKDVDLRELIYKGDEFLITCVVCMQYFFL